MRIAIISDIHGNHEALQAVLRDLDRSKPDKIVNLGDLIARGPQPAECLDELDRLGAVTVRGNTDEWVVKGVSRADWQPFMDYTRRYVGDRDLTWLAELPFSHEDAGVLYIHGSPRSNMEFLLPGSEPEVLTGTSATTVACGHHHVAYQFRTESGHLILSPGSVGMPWDGEPGAPYLLFDSEPGRTVATSIRVAYDARKVLGVAEERGYPDMAFLERALLRGQK